MEGNKFRSTYVTDRKTIAALKALAKLWKVSRAQALRRSVQLTWKQEQARTQSSPTQVLIELCSALSRPQACTAQLSKSKALSYLREIKTERKKSH